MAQYQIPEADECLQCPYDRAHMVRAKRFPYHLMKCRKNYVGKDFVSCPFNAKHEMPKPELRYHLTVCPDKALLNQEFAYEMQKSEEEKGGRVQLKGCTDLPPPTNFEVPSTEEWDSEATVAVSVGESTGHSRFRFRDPTCGGPREKRGVTMVTNGVLKDKIPASQHNGVGASKDPELGQLRRPKTTPKAMPDPELEVQPPQPISTVFAYALRQSQQPRGSENAEVNPPVAAYGRGRGSGSGLLGLGRGAGLALPPKAEVAPPPGFRGRGRGNYVATGF